MGERMGNQPIPSVGSMTAPKPDLRVRIAGAVANQGTGTSIPILKVEIQNHSTVPVYLAGFSLVCPMAAPCLSLGMG
jgi:hypothetical protein